MRVGGAHYRVLNCCNTVPHYILNVPGAVLQIIRLPAAMMTEDRDSDLGMECTLCTVPIKLNYYPGLY